MRPLYNVIFCVMLIYVSKTFSYQPPIPADQVRPSNNFDNEGGGFLLYVMKFDEVYQCFYVFYRDICFFFQILDELVEISPLPIMKI